MSSNDYPSEFRKGVLWLMLFRGRNAHQAASERGIPESTAKEWYDEAVAGTPLLETIENMRKYQKLYQQEQEKRASAEKVVEYFAEKCFEKKSR